MFFPDYFALECGLTKCWLHTRWSSPPVVPEKVEFLEAQQTLYYGILYLAESPASAAEFFADGNIQICNGAFLIVANADAQSPAWVTSVPMLSVLGLADSAGRIFNAFAGYRKSILTRQRVPSFEKAWATLLSVGSAPETDLGELLEPYLDIKARYFQLAVIRSHDDTQPILSKDFAREVHNLIPHSQAVVSPHEIVIVMSHNEYLRGCPCNEAALTEILNSCDAYMSLSMTSGYLRDLRPLYHLCSRSLEISKEMGFNNKRILHAKDHFSFNLIDLAAKSYHREFSDYNGFMLLAHPAIVELLNYDCDNEDNLTDVLYGYLLCNCNAAKAGSHLFMHRNTVVNKIKKITKLIGDDLTDNNTRQILLYSCQIAAYTQKILKIHPK